MSRKTVTRATLAILFAGIGCLQVHFSEPEVLVEEGTMPTISNSANSSQGSHPFLEKTGTLDAAGESTLSVESF